MNSHPEEGVICLLRFLTLAIICFCGQACTQDSAVHSAQGVNETSNADTGFAMLLHACAIGDERAVEKIVEGSSNSVLNMQASVTGDTALQRATDSGHAHIVEYLLSKGASPNLAGKEGNTPLIQASYKGFDKITQVLLANGADPNAMEGRFGHSPLTLAARIGHVQIVEQLLAAGADTEHRTKEGKTARRIAEERGFAEVIVAIDAQRSRTQSRNSRPPLTTLGVTARLEYTRLRFSGDAADTWSLGVAYSFR